MVWGQETLQYDLLLYIQDADKLDLQLTFSRSGASAFYEGNVLLKHL